MVVIILIIPLKKQHEEAGKKMHAMLPITPILIFAGGWWILGILSTQYDKRKRRKVIRNSLVISSRGSSNEEKTIHIHGNNVGTSLTFSINDSQEMTFAVMPMKGGLRTTRGNFMVNVTGDKIAPKAFLLICRYGDIVPRAWGFEILPATEKDELLAQTEIRTTEAGTAIDISIGRGDVDIVTYAT